jgi:hypothetical protein
MNEPEEKSTGLAEQRTDEGNGFVTNERTDMVTIARFEDHLEAEVARGVLEAAGIPCFLHGENANNLIPAAFGVRLQVAPGDEADARTVLETDAAPGEVPGT